MKEVDTGGKELVFIEALNTPCDSKADGDRETDERKECL